MMRIAVASQGEQVSEHFGHCEAFALFDVENGTIVREQTVASPEHKPGALPAFFKEMAVHAVITGGIGAGAIALLQEGQINVVTGVHGSMKVAVEEYIAGKLVTDGHTCAGHQHEKACQGDCGHDHGA